MADQDKVRDIFNEIDKVIRNSKDPITLQREIVRSQYFIIKRFEKLIKAVEAIKLVVPGETKISNLKDIPEPKEVVIPTEVKVSNFPEVVVPEKITIPEHPKEVSISNLDQLPKPEVNVAAPIVRVSPPESVKKELDAIHEILEAVMKREPPDPIDLVMTIKVDESIPDITYIGEAVIGTKKDEAKWRIRKIVTDGKETEDLISGTEYNKTWDKRKLLKYG